MSRLTNKRKNKFSNYNSSTSKITLDSENNVNVTLDSNSYHTLSKQDKQFIKNALKINRIDLRPFSFLDFQQLSKVNFRQKILKNRRFIEVVKKGHPTFYKIKGIELPGDSHHITLKNRGVGEKFLDLIESLKNADPTIHDIKIKFQSNLHENLVKKGAATDKTNKSILVSAPVFDNNVNAKILVFPNTTQIDIGCTYKPLVYDVAGILKLHEILSQISYHLIGFSDCILPSVHEWIVTHYHFAKDGSWCSGQTFHMTFEEVTSGLIRFYSKQMPDGTKIPRLEQIRTPNRSLKEELQEVLAMN